MVTADHRYLLDDDELDEQTYGHNTHTVVIDRSDPDLDNPVLASPPTEGPARLSPGTADPV